MLVQITLSALFLAAAALEIVLLVAKGYLLGERRTKAIEAQIAEAQEGLKKTLPLIEERKKRLLEAYNESERVIADTEEVSKRAVAQRQIKPMLVHTAGQRAGDIRWRARVYKTLPEEPERNQSLIWDFDNYVDVWTADRGDARAAALRQFPPEAGYTVEEFVLLAPPAGAKVPEPEKVAG